VVVTLVELLDGGVVLAIDGGGGGLAATTRVPECCNVDKTKK
jgi:hypothetical protein